MLGLLFLATVADPLAGQWRGTSICQLRPSPCNDEQAVYMIERKGPGYVVHFGKMVNGKAEEFDVAPGSFDIASHRLTVTGHGRRGDFTWHLRVEGDRLTGTLSLPNGTIYRKADLKHVSANVTPLG